MFTAFINSHEADYHHFLFHHHQLCLTYLLQHPGMEGVTQTFIYESVLVHTLLSCQSFPLTMKNNTNGCPSNPPKLQKQPSLP